VLTCSSASAPLVLPICGVLYLWWVLYVLEGLERALAARSGSRARRTSRRPRWCTLCVVGFTCAWRPIMKRLYSWKAYICRSGAHMLIRSVGALSRVINLVVGCIGEKHPFMEGVYL
jgi:hypothetical protein